MRWFVCVPCRIVTRFWRCPECRGPVQKNPSFLTRVGALAYLEELEGDA